ncbi:MAG: methionine synthase, partial [Candidatus Rokubacteria bacterium]|nr:methionine synthase [Candidatus Rokubacteria bacterium]
MQALPLIPTAVIGSHGKPGWWFAAVKAFEAGEFGPADLEEMFDDAADAAIRDMEGAGLDVITDGEVRRLDGYVDSYYAIIKGIQPLAVRRKAGPWGYDQQTRYEAVGRIETTPGGLGIVKEFEYLQAHTTRRSKATCAGPLTFGSRIHPGHTYKGVVDVAERFAEVINAELKALVAVGADWIQLDEPARG